LIGASCVPKEEARRRPIALGGAAGDGCDADESLESTFAADRLIE